MNAGGTLDVTWNVTPGGQHCPGATRLHPRDDYAEYVAEIGAGRSSRTWWA
ncbi:MAG: hypothetical protein R3A10_04745 [Caldilineaceae bacterium]